MDAKPKAKGSWGQRFFVILLSIILGVLLFWLLGFITKDIGSMPGPRYDDTRERYVGNEPSDQQKSLNKEVKDIERQISVIRQQQQILRDSSTSLQNTINQLLSGVKEFEPSEEISQTIRQSQAAFLENQKKYELCNQQIAELTGSLNEKQDSLTAVNGLILNKEKDAQKEFDRLYQRHRLKVAVIKLCFLLPVFLVASFFFMTKRTGNYWPLVWAAFIAVFIKVALVVHEYFPRKYFKYVALLVLIAIVLRLLIYVIKRIISPRKELLIRQYQQDYDKNICPVCSKPIRTNQLLYSSLAQLTKKSGLLKEMQTEVQQSYSCPSCGTNLYAKCEKCQQTRHTLLPYCLNCGSQKTEPTPSTP